MIVGADGIDPRAGEGEHPTEVGRADEVPGRAKDMCANDVPSRERLLDVPPFRELSPMAPD
jgi:hypothetical protein